MQYVVGAGYLNQVFGYRGWAVIKDWLLKISQTLYLGTSHRERIAYERYFWFFLFLMALVEIFPYISGVKRQTEWKENTGMNNLLQIVCLVNDEPE